MRRLVLALWMMPSISSPRSSVMRSSSAAAGAPSVRVAAGVVVQLLRQQPDQPGDGPRPHRQVQRRHAVAEGLAAGGQGRLKSARWWSILVITTARGMPTAAHSSHSILVSAVDALGGGDGEQRCVGRAQPGPQVAREVGVAGRVEQVDLDAVVDDRREGQVDRTLLPDLGLVEVADRGAVLDAARALDRAGRGEQRLDQAWSSRSRNGRPARRSVSLIGRRCPAGGSCPPHCLFSATEVRLLAIVQFVPPTLRTTSLNPRAPCPQPPRKESPRLPESEAGPSGRKTQLSPAVGSDGHAERAAARHDPPVHPRWARPSRAPR